MGYKSFMVEVGLYGNTVSYNYKRHSMLTMSDTWFKNIWELISCINDGLNPNGDFHLKPVWQGIKSLMLEFLCIWEFDWADHVSLNVMRMHKNDIHISDIVLCDCKAIKPEMLLDLPGQSDTHKFPHQHPTQADLSLWRRALRTVSSEFHILTVPLQDYVSPPYDLPQWMLNNDGSILHDIITCGNQTTKYMCWFQNAQNPIAGNG